jgi:predicted nucleic acid-binding Zn ribbon protein
MSTWRPFSSPDEPPQPIGAALDRLSRKLGGPSGAVLRTIFGRWEEIVGPSVAANVRPVSLRGTTLVVATEASAWATQMAFLAPDLVAKVNAELGASTLTSIEARVRASHGPTKPT